MRPKIFLGSSVESKPIKDAIEKALDHFAWCKGWEYSFDASKFTLESLIEQANDHDFAVFVFSDDDDVKMRREEYRTTRDNVVFETGLFMGVLGRDRVFIVHPRDISNFHILSDLVGFTMIKFDSERVKEPGQEVAGVSIAAGEIKAAIKQSSWENNQLEIIPYVSWNENISVYYKLKLSFKIKNNNHFPLLIHSIDFEFNNTIKLDTTASDHKKPLFAQWGKGDKHIYADRVLVMPGEKVFSCWVPISEDFTKTDLQNAIDKKAVGKWKYDVTFLKEHVITCKYKDQI